jgi:hypothetical protein
VKSKKGVLAQESHFLDAKVRGFHLACEWS